MANSLSFTDTNIDEILSEYGGERGGSDPPPPPPGGSYVEELDSEHYEVGCSANWVPETSASLQITVSKTEAGRDNLRLNEWPIELREVLKTYVKDLIKYQKKILSGAGDSAGSNHSVSEVFTASNSEYEVQFEGSISQSEESRSIFTLTIITLMS